MKLHFYGGLAVLVTAAAAWAGRTAWRAHKDLVTLHVRNMPLAEVIRGVERQTWETIIPDARLDAQITLNIDDVPLSEALDRVAEQAGGMALTVHAVYKSKPAVGKLLSAFRNGDTAKAEGWTNLAPNLDLPKGEPFQPDPNREPGAAENRRPVRVHHDVIVRRGGKGEVESVSDGSAPIIRIRGPGQESEEVIAPERLVIEASLKPLVKEAPFLTPTRTSAQLLAKQTHGKWATLYGLKKVAGAGMLAGPLRRFKAEGPVFGAKGDLGDRLETLPVKAPSNGSPLDAAEREARRNGLSRFANLTPEQRAQRLREGSSQIDVEIKE